MSDTVNRASAVIVRAGIVGNSLLWHLWHLARLGRRDLVLVDKGPMPNPGGSTRHASSFIFQVEYSKMMTELTRDSTEQYRAPPRAWWPVEPAGRSGRSKSQAAVVGSPRAHRSRRLPRCRFLGKARTR